MATQLQIWNMGLEALGQRPIAEDEDSDRARKIKAPYEEALRVTLRAYNWSFACPVISLEESDYISPYVEYPYAYKYPENCKKIIKIFAKGQPTDAEALKFNRRKLLLSDDNKRIIVANVPKALCEYSIDLNEVENKEELFDDMFCEAFAYQLAYKAAISITGDSAKRDDMLALYTQSIESAAAVNENESVVKTDFISDFEKARYIK